MKTALILCFGLALISCEKDAEIVERTQKNQVVFAKDDEVKDLTRQTLTSHDKNGDVFDCTCVGTGGSCLPEFVLVGKHALYDELVRAIALDDQPSFLSKNNYGDVFDMNTNVQVQDALIKGHLKLYPIEIAQKQWLVFTKPQHISLGELKMIKKARFMLPIN